MGKKESQAQGFEMKCESVKKETCGRDRAAEKERIHPRQFFQEPVSMRQL